MTRGLGRWRTACVAGLVVGVVFGCIEGFSFFALAFSRDLGGGRGATSAIFAVYLLVGAALAPIAGRVIDRWGTRWVVVRAFPVFAAGLALCAAADGIWQLYVLYAGPVAIAGVCLTQSAQVLVRGAYDADRGTAVGIMYAGLGIGNFVLFSVLGVVVQAAGWRAGYLAAAGVAALAAVVFAVVVRSEPGRIPAVPSGNGSLDRSAVSSYALPLMVSAAFLAGIIDFVTFQHLAPFLVQSGFQESRAASLLGLASLGYVAGQLGGGALSDRMSRELAGTLGALVFVAATVTLWVSVAATALVLPLVFLLGLAVGALVGSASSAVGDLFAGSALGRASGIVSVGSTAGAATGTLLGGIGFDLTGGYGVTFAAAAGGALIWIAVIWSAGPRHAIPRPASAA